jgi:hypothetical protein
VGNTREREMGGSERGGGGSRDRKPLIKRVREDSDDSVGRKPVVKESKRSRSDRGEAVEVFGGRKPLVVKEAGLIKISLKKKRGGHTPLLHPIYIRATVPSQARFTSTLVASNILLVTITNDYSVSTQMTITTAQRSPPRSLSDSL